MKAALLALLISAPAYAHQADAIIAKAATLTGAPEKLIHSICWVESAGQLDAFNPSDGNGTPSFGLCQMKESTARMLGYAGVAEGLFDPLTNATFAGLYLNTLIARYHGNWKYAIAAYNSGSVRLNKTGEVRNIHYVTKVLKEMKKYEQRNQTRSGATRPGLPVPSSDSE